MGCPPQRKRKKSECLSHCRYTVNCASPTVNLHPNVELEVGIGWQGVWACRDFIQKWLSKTSNRKMKHFPSSWRHSSPSICGLLWPPFSHLNCPKIAYITATSETGSWSRPLVLRLGGDLYLAMHKLFLWWKKKTLNILGRSPVQKKKCFTKYLSDETLVILRFIYST